MERGENIKVLSSMEEKKEKGSNVMVLLVARSIEPDCEENKSKDKFLELFYVGVCKNEAVPVCLCVCACASWRRGRPSHEN